MERHNLHKGFIKYDVTRVTQQQTRIWTFRRNTAFPKIFLSSAPRPASYLCVDVAMKTISQRSFVA